MNLPFGVLGPAFGTKADTFLVFEKGASTSFVFEIKGQGVFLSRKKGGGVRYQGGYVS